MRYQSAGFTIIELVISVAIAGGLFLVVSPTLNDSNANRKIRAAAREFQATIQYARTEAITRNALVSLQTLNTSDTDSWNSDIQICTVANTGDSCSATGAQLIKVVNVGQNSIAINSNNIGDSIISITAKGRLDEGVSNEVTLGFCDDRTDGDHQFMTISVTGRPNYIDLDTRAGHACDP